MDDPCKNVRIIRHNKRLKPDEPKIQPWCTVHHKWNCDKNPKAGPSRGEDARTTTTG